MLFHVDKSTFAIQPKAPLIPLKRRNGSKQLHHPFVDTVIIGTIFKSSVIRKVAHDFVGNHLQFYFLD
jgi:hypothetical protein